MKKDNIILVGFMGSGKTTIGKVIARLLGREFIDMDQVLEEKYGMSVNQIFAKHGESVFRQSEHQLCQDLAMKSHKVISTGGGTILQSQNLEILKSCGLVIHIFANEKVLTERLTRSQRRPLLLSDSKQGVIDKIRHLLEQRKGIYNKVKVRLETTKHTPLSAAQAVVQFLKNHPVELSSLNQNSIDIL